MKHKKLKIALISATVAVLMLVASMTVYAYFTTRVYVYTDNGDKQVAQVGMNLQLLFGKLELTDTPNLGIPSYNAVDANGNDIDVGSGVWSPVAGDGQYLSFNDGSADNPTNYNPQAPWGSAQNPYVISESRHLQNLSALQSVGYFDLLYIANNFDADGNYIEGSASIPYFVICNTDGTPVTISGTELAAIEPIGSAEHPFVGVIGGAFVEGVTTVAGKTTDDDKNSSVSTIHDFDVQTNTNQTDVGLFGYVGFLGKEPTAAELETLMKDNTYVPHFTGVFSSIRELLISDVQVTVNNPTVIEVISELFEPLWKKFFGESNVLHRFTFSDKSNAAELFHETHHIGIFAGHVSYAMIDEINVYYSDEGTYALDVTGANLGEDKDNYYSASGILGMMYNMNCTIENSDAGHCRVLLGTGTSGDEVGNGGEGTGTGGGALSGNGRGYVTAAEIFTDFNNVDVSQSNNELLWEYLLQGSAETNRVTGAILIYKNGTSYTLADGKTAATINDNGASVTADGKTWSKFFIRETYTNDKGEQRFRYFGPNGTTPLAEYELMGNKYNGQTIWKYSAGGNGIWHYGIRVLKSGDTYKLDDGTTTVEYDDINGRITTEDGTTVWENFFITEIIDGTNESYMFDPTNGTRLDITTFMRKPMTLIEAYRINEETNDREDLCIEWENTFLGSTTKMGLYYFYDGVFTFGLSSPEDTICDTWENAQVPNLYLGGTKAEDWEVLSTDNQAVVAFLKPITSNQELAEAITNKRQVYITSQPSEAEAGSVFLMSLINHGLSITSGQLSFDGAVREKVYKAYTEDGYTTLPKVPDINATGGYSAMNTTVEQLVEEYWGTNTKNKILLIGRDSEDVDIDKVRSNYNIIPSVVSGKYYYYDPDGLPVTPNTAAGTVPVYERFENGFFYYQQTGATDTGGPRYSFYYQPSTGAPVTLRNNDLYDNNNWGRTSLERYISNNLTSAGTSTEGSEEPLYTNGNTTVGIPIVNMDATAFHSGAAAYIQGNVVAKAISGQSQSYYYWDATDGNTYTYQTTPYSGSIPEGAVLLKRYPAYTFSDYSQNSFLRLVRTPEKLNELNILITTLKWYTGRKYYVWAGTNDQLENIPYYKKEADTGYNATNNTEAILVFNSNGSCNIQYSIDSTSKYVNGVYDVGSQSVTFGMADTNANAGTTLYVYSIEGVLDMDYGASKFVPKEDYTGTVHELPANSVVLWPQTSLKAEHTIPDANGVNQNYAAGIYSNLGPFDNTKVQTFVTDTHTAASDNSPDPVYSIIPLTGTGGLNWGTKNGYKLGDYGLDKKFRLADQTGFGPMINLNDIFGLDLGNLPLGESNVMIAPVGSNGVEANVPKGCVAFRVNAGGKQSIRVIVAVPTTDKYLGEQGFELDMLKDYYIGVWQVEASGESIVQQFSKADALEKFELPRSYMFNAETTPVAADNAAAGAVYKNYVDVQYQGQNYRTYLNGDCFLVGYEFTVYGEGVYVIGSVHGSDNDDATKDVPMEIVHFSVSGTASAGRDGVTGNQLGAIDFVYDDTDGNIATIDKTGSTTGPTNGTEYYSNYYASQCLLYSNNEQKDTNGAYILLNKEKLWIRRYVDNSTPNSAKTVIAYGVDGVVPDSFLVKQYAINSDEVETETTQ